MNGWSPFSQKSPIKSAHGTQQVQCPWVYPDGSTCDAVVDEAKLGMHIDDHILQMDDQEHEIETIHTGGGGGTTTPGGGGGTGTTTHTIHEKKGPR